MDVPIASCLVCGNQRALAVFVDPAVTEGLYYGVCEPCRSAAQLLRAPVPPKQTCPFCKRDFNIIKKDLPKFWCPDNSDGQA